MRNPTTPLDPLLVQTRLRELLFALLKQNDSCPFESAEAIPDDVDLTTVGLTSIDLLEFVMSVEQEFHVAILDSMEPDDLPLTLAGWRQQVDRFSAG